MFLHGITSQITDFEMQQAEAHLHQNLKFMSPMLS
jgi:hypothetical protein